MTHVSFFLVITHYPLNSYRLIIIINLMRKIRLTRFNKKIYDGIEK